MWCFTPMLVQKITLNEGVGWGRGAFQIKQKGQANKRIKKAQAYVYTVYTTQASIHQHKDWSAAVARWIDNSLWRTHSFNQTPFLSLAGRASTSIIFVVATKVCLLLCLSRQITCLSWQRFLARQAYFCRDKRRVLSREKRVCGDKTFVTTKMILVAAPANDNLSYEDTHSAVSPLNHRSGWDR